MATVKRADKLPLKSTPLLRTPDGESLICNKIAGSSNRLHKDLKGIKLINYKPYMYSEQDIFKAIAGGKEPTYGKFGARVFVPDMDREEGLRYAAYELSKTIIHDAILPVLYSPIFIRTKLLTRNSYEYYPYGVEIMADMDIQNVKERPVIYKFVTEYSQIPKDVYKCDHCGGHTKNDMRGNCLACGAPRNDDYLNGW